jgi:capsid assembly protease
MNLLDVLTSPWAIVPEKLIEIQEIYFKHSRGEKIDIASIEAKIGKPLKNESKPYRVVNDIAIIPVHGVMAKRANMFTQISGGVSSELVMRDIGKALDDPDVRGVVLDIDSPGGTMDGTLELANFIFEGRDKKKIIAHSDGTMGSAAYWIGSAAHEIYISGDTVQTGSIGVVAQHVDYSKFEEKEGIKTTEIYAGRYKRIASQHEPLSEDGRKYIQSMVDYLYTVFVDSVARFRGVSSDTVLQNMADGRIFIGKQGITAGLVNDIATLDKLTQIILPAMQVKNKVITSKKEVNMDLEQLKAEHPDLYKKIQDDTKESVTAQFNVEREQLETANKELQDQVATLTETNEELGKENKEIGKRMVALEQKDAARDRRDAQDRADEIFNAALGESKIPAKHHDRVKRGVSFDGFYKDGEFDRKGFSEAVKTEIEDWEKDIGPEVAGAGFVGRAAEGETVEDDDALVDELVGMVQK